MVRIFKVAYEVQYSRLYWMDGEVKVLAEGDAREAIDKAIAHLNDDGPTSDRGRKRKLDAVRILSVEPIAAADID